MWEGQSVERGIQLVCGILMGVLALPLWIIGLFMIPYFLKKADMNTAIIASVLSLVCFYFCILAYRLVRARGVKQGGGIMSPRAFAIGGWSFVALPILTFFFGEPGYPAWQDIGAALICYVLASFFFIAARHRGAVRQIN